MGLHHFARQIAGNGQEALAGNPGSVYMQTHANFKDASGEAVVCRATAHSPLLMPLPARAV